MPEVDRPSVPLNSAAPLVGRAHAVAALAVTAATSVVLSGCGTTTTKPTGRDEVRQILGVVQAARSALLGDRSHDACILLTAHGRERVLGFQVDFADEGTPVPSKDPHLPQTCEAVFIRESAQPGARWWRADLRNAQFSVSSINGATATARLKVEKPYGPVIRFTLRKTKGRWRIDDSDGVPEGY